MGSSSMSTCTEDLEGRVGEKELTVFEYEGSGEVEEDGVMTEGRLEETRASMYPMSW
jgi:hypothetical protein